MPFTIRKIDDRRKRRMRLALKSIVLSALELSRPVLHWYGDWKKLQSAEKMRKERIRVLKKILLVLISVLIALTIVSVLAKAFFSVELLSLPQMATVAIPPPPSDENGVTNILLIGQGTADHDGKDLTDSIIVASIDPKTTKSAVLLSLPRDLYFLKTEKMGAGKLNTFYRDYKGYLKYIKEMDQKEASMEAIREIGNEVGRTLDIKIHGVIKIDFEAFVQAVDTLGGADIEVPYDIIDNEYPDDNFGYEPFIIRKGHNHLDGKTALKYARSRSTTSDFGRSARQGQLLGALFAKAKETGAYKNPGVLINFLKIYSDHIETSLNSRELVGLLPLLTEIGSGNMISMQLNDRNALYDGFIEPGGFLYSPPRDLFSGASVLLPVSIPEFPVTWKQIQGLKKLLFDSRSIYLRKPSFSILNAGAPGGHARKLATELTRYGFTIDLVANASLPKQDKSFIASHETSADSGDFFARLLKVELRPAPAGLKPDETRAVTIVIGKDYKYGPLQSYIFPE